MKNLLSKLLLFNLPLEKADRLLRYKFVFLNNVYFFAAIVTFIMGFIRWNTSQLISMLDFGFSGISLLVLYYLHRHHEKIELVSTIGLIQTFLLFFVIYLFSPYNATSSSLFFLLLAASFFLKGRKQSLWWTVVFIFSIIAAHFTPYPHTAYSHLDVLITCFYLIAFFLAFDNYGMVQEEQSEELNLLNEQLEQEVLDRTQKLETANNDLLTSNQQITSTLNELKLLEREENLINKLNAMLQICTTADETYPRINIIAEDIFSGLSGGLSIYQKDNQQLDTVTQWGPDKILDQSFAANDCFGIRGGVTNVIDDPKKSIPCKHYSSPPKGGYMGIPMSVLNELIGVIHLLAPEGQSIPKHIQELAVVFANIIKIALTNINLRQSLEALSLRDPLTGLYNRRYLNEFLPRELLRIARDQTTLVVAMLDIDDFKKFNDTYGHDAGDEVLKFIGLTLNQNFRANDIACRFGGEEFLLVMLNCELNVAINRLEFIRTLLKSAMINYQGKYLPKITLSFGVALAPMHGKTLEPLIAAADQALYKAKNAGKDRIELYEL